MRMSFSKAVAAPREALAIGTDLFAIELNHASQSILLTTFV
jgi:hypothetical protein